MCFMKLDNSPTTNLFADLPRHHASAEINGAHYVQSKDSLTHCRPKCK